MSIIKHVPLQKIVAHDFRYDPRIIVGLCITQPLGSGNEQSLKQPARRIRDAGKDA